MDKCDILFILPSYPEPRNTNIINAVKQKFNVKVIYWEKKKNSLTYKNSNCEVTPILIRANDHKPLLRIFRTFLFQKKLLKEITKTQPSCIHVSKLDSLLVASEYKRNKNNNVRIVYDVSDMHNLAYNDNNSFFSRMIKKQLYNFEKKCSYYVNRLLITSPKFFEEYYFNFYNKEQIIFVTNSPNESVFSSFFPHKGRFTVGFVGSIRYPNQMKMLIDISNDMDIDVLFAGGGVYEKALREYSKHNKNVFFIGQYDYDSQIASIYSRIDCLYVQYDTTIKNVRIALPNKLYEGAFCGIPIIVSHGVYLAEIVNKYKLGFDVIDGDKSDLIKKINDVRVLNKEELQHNCKVFYEANSFKTTIVKLLAAYEEMCNDS